MTEHKKIGRYVIESRLGEGAMGSVFLAHDPFINRKVAIKTVKLDSSRKEEEGEEFYERFMREAQISGQINHPNIVQIFDVGEQDGMPYIAMEYVDGETLNAYCKDIPKPPLADRLKILVQIASALDYAHEKSIVHRDLKPSNIMVMRDGTGKIMDFGIAKMSDSNLTQTGVFLGTPSYSSPEQVKEGIVDFRSDIFCFGILSHEVISGHLPFPGQTINAILYKIANEPPAFAPNLKELPIDPIAWRQIFSRVLNKSPEQRYQSASEFISAVMDIATLSDEDRTLVGRVQTDLNATVRDPNLGKNLRRSDYDLDAQRTVVDRSIQPQQKKSARLFVLLFLLLVSIAVALSARFGYLDDTIETVMALVNPEKPEKTVEVVEDTPPKVVPILKTVPITTTPPGATISANGKVLGKSPQNYAWQGLDGDRLIVKAEMDGHAPAEQTLIFSKDKAESVALTLNAMAVLREIKSSPAGAAISVDGKNLGAAPASFHFTKGKSYAIVAEKDGYYKKTLTYEEGKTKTGNLNLSLKAVPPPGFVAVDTLMEDLRITIGGATQRGTKAEVKAGSYKVRLRSAKYFYDQLLEEVPVKPGETTTLKTPILITIPMIDFIGAYVKVKIDGQFVKNAEDEIDTTPLIDLQIAAGNHTFEFIDQDGSVVARKTFEVVKSEAIIQKPGNPDN